MRKLYVLFIFSFITAAVLSYYSTFYVGNQVRRNFEVYEPEKVQNIEENPAQTNQGTPKFDDPEYEELVVHNVGGRRFVLLETNFKNQFTTALVEAQNGSYLPLSDEYKWANDYSYDGVADFWFDDDNRKLYLLKFGYYDGEFELFEVDYSDRNNITQASVHFSKGGYPRKQFIDFNVRENSFIFLEEYGDGCGSHGYISNFNLETKATNLVTEIGIGCVEDPRYFRYYKGKLILGDVVDCTVQTKYNEQCLKNIYSLDPFNLNNKDTIYSFSQPYVYDMSFLLYEENAPTLTEEEIALAKLDSNYNDVEAYIFNLETMSMRLITY